jgi:uncharacterized protein YecE (DUF72 family)
VGELATVRVGTCSFADEALTSAWYPRGIRTGAERLRYYAERFDTVEIDSTFYALPAAERTETWAERTPPGFVFHVKAFAMMTRHPVRAEQLPPDLRDLAELDERGRVERPSRELRAAVFERFHEALEPLRAAGKLGGILMQFPPYVVPKEASYEYLAWAQTHLGGDEMLTEFRHRSWLDDEHREEVLRFLEDRRQSLVVVDAPRTGGKNVLPTVVAVTGPTAYVRMHGRNAGTWNVRGGSAAERFDYLYSEQELSEWVEPLRELASAASRLFVFFNNNGQSTVDDPDAPLRIDGNFGEPQTRRVAQAPTNAVMLRQLLKDAGLPVNDPTVDGA